MKAGTHRAGFTFIEVLVVIAILLILVAVSVATFKNLGTSSTHRIATQEVLSALSEARNRSIASENDTTYGVYFATSSVTIFAGSVYSQSDPNNILINFTGGVHATSSLSNNSTEVVFQRLSGFPTATGTVHVMRGDNMATNTITIHNSGLVEI